MKMENPAWRFNGNERKYLEEVLATGFRAGADGAFTMRLENFFATVYNAKYGITFNSGTTTLHSILLAMGCSKGDEVLTPALTPIMCGLAPYYTGATPVYVDSLPDTFLMDPEDIKRKITPKTKVIFVTHMYGAVCDMRSIMAIAKEHKLFVLEDCAQCHMGRNDEGQLAGTIGDAGSWSFENSKQLTCGDGGIVTTSNQVLAEKIRRLGGLGFKTLTASSGKVRTDRDLLQNPNWERFESIGYNYRMGQLAAAVALAQMEQNDYFINLRRASGLQYTNAISNSELLTAQHVSKGNINTYYTFSAKFNGEHHGVKWEDFREKYMAFGGDGIYAAAKLIHQEPAFYKNKIGYGETPIAVDLQKRLMNFTTNQASAFEREVQMNAMSKTLKYFGDNPEVQMISLTGDVSTGKKILEAASHTIKKTHLELESKNSMENLTRFGIVQGRLSQAPLNSLQWFPQESWEMEFKAAAEIGIDFIELIAECHHNPNNPIWSDAGVKKIQELVANNLLTLHSLCNDFLIENSLLDDQVIQQNINLINKAKNLGIEKYILPLLGKTNVSSKNINEYVESIRIVARAANKHNMVTCLETVLPGEELVKLLELIDLPYVKAVFDTGLLGARGYDLPSDIRLLGDYISHIHIKDKNRNDENMLLGTGIVNFEEVFSALKDINYDGPFTLETVRGNDPIKTAIFNIQVVEFFRENSRLNV